MQIVLDTRGIQMSVRNSCFMLSTEARKRIIHPERVTGIMITAPCRVSTPSLILAAEYQIPVTIFSPTGKPLVNLHSPRMSNIATLRRKQYRYSESVLGVEWCRLLICEKLKGQHKSLEWLRQVSNSTLEILESAIQEIALKQKQLANESFLNDSNIPIKTLKNRLFYIEANCAMHYWKAMGSVVPEPFTFTQRVKRKPVDPFNCCLNYLYGMLYNQMEGAILGCGLDPTLGMLHRDGYALPTLAFDLMEPFRPMIDQMLLEMIVQNKMPTSLLQPDEDGQTKITKEARKQLISAFLSLMQAKRYYRGSTTTVGNHLLTDVKRLSKAMANS